MWKFARTRGFTLVELLVVIGIIAAMVALLLPALSRAREAANSAVCKSNLRQIGLGFIAYANTYKGYLPAGWTNYTRSGDPIDWSGLISPLLSGPQIKSYDLMARLRCPSNVLAAAAKLPAEGYSYAVGTGLNGNLTRPDLGPLPMKINHLRRPSDKIMVFETNTPTSYVGSVNFDFSGNKSAWAWHRGSINTLMCDGSVRSFYDKWLLQPTAFRAIDQSEETRLYWFRTTQSSAAFAAGGYDRLWK